MNGNKFIKNLIKRLSIYENNLEPEDYGRVEELCYQIREVMKQLKEEENQDNKLK